MKKHKEDLYCFECGDELNALDMHPNGDMPCICARCEAEQRHDFDKEPNARFNRAGDRIADRVASRSR